VRCKCDETLASKIQELKILGMSNRDIALRLKIDRKTVAKGLML
jgi:DNA-binding CsgD family transcriptional regulator